MQQVHEQPTLLEDLTNTKVPRRRLGEQRAAAALRRATRPSTGPSHASGPDSTAPPPAAAAAAAAVPSSHANAAVAVQFDHEQQ